jgi:bacterioferritin-associated ferredoxin
MYVCVCFAVSQAEVDRAICDGAHSREAVTRACKAGGDCGACHGMIQTMIEDHLDSDASGVRRACPAVVSTTADQRAAVASTTGTTGEDSGPKLVPEQALVRTRAA